MKTILHSLTGAFLALLLLAAVGAGIWTYQQWQVFHTPLRLTTQTFVVAKGTTFEKAVQQLNAEGMGAHPFFLRIYARLNPGIRNIKAGEYVVGPYDSMATVLHRIRRGEVAQHVVTIPEGRTVREIAALLEHAGITRAEPFIKLALNPASPARFGIEASSLEGYLFPDTYHFAANVDPVIVVKTMVDRFLRSLPTDYTKRAQSVGLSLHQAVTLASIIEKETGSADERRLISAVFHNRLKKRMRLQSDPTVIYGMANFDGNLRKKDLQENTPYNTYRIAGLPPGPIANPGRAALVAAVDPAPVAYLYFVSRNDGTHYFSPTLEEHNRAVALYQKRRIQAGSP